MSEMDQNNSGMESFEDMLNESLVTLHTGDIVKGTVIQVSNGEVSVNLGYKSDGLISKGEFSEDSSVDPADYVKKDDEIEVYVIRVNDGDGNVLLSRKRLEIQKGFEALQTAAEEGTPIAATVNSVVKGGLVALVHGIRAFIPSSQISNRYVEDLAGFVGKEYNFAILEFDKAKRRLVIGRRDLAAKELQEKKDKLYEKIEAGQRLEGTVNRIVDFGAFVDLGGVDGLIHISELSWSRVRNVSSVLTEGDKVTVTVLDVDRTKDKISLSLKDLNNDPWQSVEENFPVGSIVKGRVVRTAPFGAFVELCPGVDGLVHISQIAEHHVVKPEDELAIGEMIDVRVTDIDLTNKKISLSKKQAEEPAAPAMEESETVYSSETGVMDESYAEESMEEEVSENPEA